MASSLLDICRVMETLEFYLYYSYIAHLNSNLWGNEISPRAEPDRFVQKQGNWLHWPRSPTDWFWKERRKIAETLKGWRAPQTGALRTFLAINLKNVLNSLQIAWEFRICTFPKVEQAGLSNASTTSLILNGCTSLGQATYSGLEFVTRVTSLACVKYFWAQVNFSRIKARNYYFCGFRPQML